tara:strand:+ start:293 stop:1453 length:1161 start_codon:yes stop_codon:yes gene_type:complete
MPSYDNDLVLTELATGEGSGTWGDTTNLNLELIGEAFSYGTGATFDSDANKTVTVDAASHLYRRMFIDVTSTAPLSATRTLEINPTTMSKTMVIKNSTSGSQSIIIKQGSGATVTIANGLTKMVVLNGAGAGAAVIDVLDSIDLGSNSRINGGQFGITADETATFTNKTINGSNNTITIANSSVASNAAIDATKIADGSVTSTEFQYINTLSSNAQTQLTNLQTSVNAKLNSALPNDTWISSADGRNRLYFTSNANTVMKYDTQWRVDNNAGSTRLTLDASGNLTAVGNVGAYSDMALKEDIYEIENALDKVKKLRGVHFTKKADKSKEIGVVANEVEKVVPELVDEVEDEKLGTIKTMKYANTVGLLIEAVKDLSKQVEELKNGS